MIMPEFVHNIFLLEFLKEINNWYQNLSKKYENLIVRKFEHILFNLERIPLII